MELPVHYEDRLVATISADAQATRFAYADAWRSSPDGFPVSLAMPIRPEPYEGEQVLPWLMNLLPEGEPLRAMTRALGAAPEDALSLIAQTGSDLAGALTIVRHQSRGEPGYRPIPDAGALERIIEELPARPFLVGEDGVSMSLAGAQEKLPVAIIDGQVAVPINGAPSTHILKPDNPRLPGSVQNEMLCMVLARRIGLNVAPVKAGVAGERSYLLVERYDRVGTGKDVRRLHQEDFCQALGRPPAAKYEFNGTGMRGPSIADMFALVRQHMTARDITRLLDAVIFNVAVGNVDSHAKNYSILLGRGAPQLAPLYDLMSGLAWPNITQNHAQALGGQRRGRHIYGRHWRRMAEGAGLAARGTIQRVEQLTARLLRELPTAVEEVAAMAAGSAMLAIFAKEIEERASEVRTHAGQETAEFQRIDSDLLKMSWPAFIHEARKDPNHHFETRMKFLRYLQTLFAREQSFESLTVSEWKAVAGIVHPDAVANSGLEKYQIGWFGSMQGSGSFTKLIANKDSRIAKAIDCIPRRGPVTEGDFDRFCVLFESAFADSARIGRYPTATRLLAMKRPDVFVCVNNGNKASLADALHFAPTTLSLDNYWERVIEPIRLAKWYNAPRPEGANAEAWDCRAALVDAIHYEAV